MRFHAVGKAHQYLPLAPSPGLSVLPQVLHSSDQCTLPSLTGHFFEAPEQFCPPALERLVRWQMHRRNGVDFSTNCTTYLSHDFGQDHHPLPLEDMERMKGMKSTGGYSSYNVKCFAHWKNLTFPQAPYSAMPTGSRVTLHWTRSQFFFYWETNVTNLDLLKMKSVTKTLQAPSPTSTKASAWPDPSFFSPQKNNHVKNLGSTSGLLSHNATPYTPPSIDTNPGSAGWV